MGDRSDSGANGAIDADVERAGTRLERATPPLFALCVAVVAVSTSAILVRWSEAPNLVKALYRVVFTIGLLAPIALSRHGGTVRSLSRRDYLVAGGAGIALAIHFASWFESLDWTSVAASVTLVQSQPLFVALGAALLLDERVNVRMWAGLAVSLCGMAVMSVGDLLTGAALAGTGPLYGNALAVIGAVAAATYVLVGRSLRQQVSLIPYVIVVYAACAATLLVLALADGAALLGYPPREWLLFVGMAIGPGVVGHTVINWALAHLDSSVVSVSLLGEPVGSAVLALVFLGEVPSSLTVVGGAVVLAGIALTAGARPTADTPETGANPNEA